MSPTPPALQKIAPDRGEALLVEAARGLGADPEELKIETFLAGSGVDDETIKLRVSARDGEPIGIVLWSGAAAPEMAARGVEAARAAAEAVGPGLDRAVLLPVVEGSLDDRSYAVMRMMNPLRTGRLTRRLDARRVLPHVFAWLTEATRATAREHDDAGLKAVLVPRLEHMRDSAALPEDLRQQGRSALERLERGSWRPRSTLMHGDLWAGNVMIDPTPSDAPWGERFVFIDWASGAVVGSPIYDLVRLGLSFGTSRRSLRGQIARQCEVLDCEPADAYSYLLTALGYIGLNRGEFPMDRFVAVARRCVGFLDACLPAGLRSD